MLNFKKTISAKLAYYIAAFLATSSPVFSDYTPEPEYISNCCAPTPCYRGTMYLNLGIGFGGVYDKSDFLTQQFDPSSELFPGPILVIDINEKGDGGCGPFGNIALGYTFPSWKRFMLSIEAGVSASPKVQSETTTTNEFGTGYPNSLEEVDNDLYLNTIYSILLKPAFQIHDDTLFYATLGYSVARAEFRRRGVDVGGTLVGFTAPLANYDIKKHKNLNAFLGGIGFTIRTSYHTEMNLGYTRTSYNSFSAFERIDDPEVDQFVTRNVKVKPDQESFLASVTYNFTPETPYCRGTLACPGHEFYAGVTGVRDNSFIATLSHEANPFAEDPLFDYINTEFWGAKSSRGWGAEAFIGYGYTIECGAYLGVEAFYNSSRTKSKFTEITNYPPNLDLSDAGLLTTSTLENKLDHSYGLIFVPGYKFNDHILLYFKLGVVRRDFTIHSTRNAIPPLQERDQVLFNFTTHKHIYGYQFGPGFDLRICNNIYLRTEYTFTQYSNLALKRRTTPLLSAGGYLVANDRVFNVRDGQYKLGLVYKFPVCCRR